MKRWAKRVFHSLRKRYLDEFVFHWNQRPIAISLINAPEERHLPKWPHPPERKLPKVIQS